MFSFEESLRATQDYLRSGASLEQFESEHGIAGKSDGQHLILDYDQLTVKWTEPYGYACRGLVLDATTFEVLAAPIKKFFNHGEHYADKIDWATAIAFEKIDGTMINRWWSPHTGRFEHSTRFQLPGGLETTSVNSGMMNWGDMIRRCMDSIDLLLLSSQPKTETWTFEVCSPHNMVVVRHSEYFAKLLAVKDNITLAELPVTDHPHGPKHYKFADAEAVAAFANAYPAAELEGFVVVDSAFNRIKIKSDKYVALHRMKDGLLGTNSILLLAKSGDTEEVTAHFPEFKPEIDAALTLIDQVISEHEAIFSKICDQSSQKDFALALNATSLEFKDALFAVRAGRHPSIRHAILSAQDGRFCKILRERFLTRS